MYLTDTDTNRMIIRPLSLDDVPAWQEFFINNPALPFLGLDDSISAHEHAVTWIERQLGRYRDDMYGHLALTDRHTHELIGQCGLMVRELDGARAIEVGYHVLPRYQGNGYATEAAIHMSRYAFRSNICSSLISMIHVDNAASQRVADKNGMKRTVRTTFTGLPVFIYRLDEHESEV